MQYAPLVAPSHVSFFGWPMLLLIPHNIEDEFGTLSLVYKWQFYGLIVNCLFLLSCSLALFYIRRDLSSRFVSLTNMLALTGAVAFCVYYFGPGKNFLSQSIKIVGLGPQIIWIFQTDRPRWHLIICCALMMVSVHGILRLVFDAVAWLQSRAMLQADRSASRTA